MAPDRNGGQPDGPQTTDSAQAQSGHDQDDGLDARIAAIVERSVAKVVNAAVTSHLRRELPKIREELATSTRTDDSDDPETRQERSKQQPEGNAETRLIQAQMERLRKQLEAVTAEREKEREALAAKERDDALRAVLEREGVRSTDVALAAIRAGLRVEEGRYVHEGQDGPKTAEEYAREFLREHSYLRRPQGKEGGGSVGREIPAAQAVGEGLSGVAKMAAAMKANAAVKRE